MTEFTPQTSVKHFDYSGVSHPASIISVLDAEPSVLAIVEGPDGRYSQLFYADGTVDGDGDFPRLVKDQPVVTVYCNALSDGTSGAWSTRYPQRPRGNAIRKGVHRIDTTVGDEFSPVYTFIPCEDPVQDELPASDPLPLS